MQRDVQVGLPYQYAQADKKWQRMFSMMNVLLRMKLSQWLPALFAPQAGLAVAAPIAANVKNVNPGTMYRDALQAANRTTRNIWVALGLLAVMVAKACGLW